MTVAMGPDRKPKREQDGFVSAVGATSKHRRCDDVGVFEQADAGCGIESQ
jgi:hypothetical protein